MWPRQFQILSPLIESDSVPKGRNIFLNEALEYTFKELKSMKYAKNLLIFPDWTIPFTIHTDSSNKYFSAVISQNNKPIVFFPGILSKI